jgi:hypothetical protein
LSTAAFARGAERVEIGTSSENVPINSFALALGFEQVLEKLRFTKVIT